MHRILIVDDEMIVRKWLRLVFQPFAEEFLVVDAVANGKEAFEVCRNTGVDIVITDMIMPDMDGMAFIQALREFDLRTQVIILSNYADFSLAQRGMSFGAAQYLLKGEVTEDELLAAVRRVAQRLTQIEGEGAVKARFWGMSDDKVVSVLNGFAQPAVLEEMQHAWEKAACVMAYCAVFGCDVAGVSAAQPMSGYVWAAALEKELREDRLAWHVYSITDTLVCALLAVEQPQSPQQLCDALEQWRDTRADTGFSVGVGLPAQRADELPRAFAQACGSLRQRFFTGPGSVCLYTPAQECETLHKADLERRFAQTKEKIQSGELAAVGEQMERQCNAFSRATVQDIDTVRGYLVSVAHVLWQRLADLYAAGEEPQRAASYSGLLQANDFLFLAELRRWFAQMIAQGIALQQRHANDASLRGVLCFLEERYMENLTLNEISEVAGFSPNYFCSVFKEYTKKSVNSYLTDIRIREAKRLLTTTSKSIYLVAESVGYESASYFIKVFKEATGQTPNGFRRSNR